jgi:hypothetical protein
MGPRLYAAASPSIEMATGTLDPWLIKKWNSPPFLVRYVSGRRTRDRIGRDEPRRQKARKARRLISGLFATASIASILSHEFPL